MNRHVIHPKIRGDLFDHPCLRSLFTHFQWSLGVKRPCKMLYALRSFKRNQKKNFFYHVDFCYFFPLLTHFLLACDGICHLGPTSIDLSPRVDVIRPVKHPKFWLFFFGMWRHLPSNDRLTAFRRSHPGTFGAHKGFRTCSTRWNHKKLQNRKFFFFDIPR